MGLFDKKYCDICGEKIGLLGNRKLEDGNICKDCASKLSPFFNERKASTVEQIREQLAYRQANQERLADFHAGKSFGNGSRKLLLDEKMGAFVLCYNSRNLQEENPDLIPLDKVTGARLDIPEMKREVFRQDREGNRIPYNPRRYEYSYDFDVIIDVEHAYFDQLRLRLNAGSVDGHDRMGCQRQKEEGESLVKYLRLLHLRQEQREAKRGPRICPFCGANTTPDEKGCCEYCGSVLVK